MRRRRSPERPLANVPLDPRSVNAKPTIWLSIPALSRI